MTVQEAKDGLEVAAHEYFGGNPVAQRENFALVRASIEGMAPPIAILASMYGDLEVSLAMLSGIAARLPLLNALEKKLLTATIRYELAKLEAE